LQNKNEATHTQKMSGITHNVGDFVEVVGQCAEFVC